MTQWIQAVPGWTLSAVGLLLGREFNDLLQGRAAKSCLIEFWPNGLTAPPLSGEREATKCEPDLLIRFNFEGESESSVLLIGEMKWEDYPPSGKLAEQVERERQAVRKHDRLRADETLVVVISQFRFGNVGANFQLTWTDAHARLSGAMGEDPVSLWAALIARFLERAKQISFQGFRHPQFLERLERGSVLFFRPDTLWFNELPKLARTADAFFYREMMR